MLYTLGVLLVCQTAGEALSWLLALPVPGPVLGMGLLLGWRRADPALAERLRGTCAELLRHMSLLFVGAGVGVVAYADRIAAEWLPIGATVVASTVLAVGVTALVVRWAIGRFGGGAP